MILTVTKTVTEQIEVEGEFPLFRQHGNSLCKVLNENSYVGVILESCIGAPQICYSDIKANVDRVIRAEEITEKQFIDAYVTAVHRFQAILYPEQQLTNEEIAKVFAMYLGCEIESDNGSTIVYSPHSCANSGYKLKLTPLSKISDEDAMDAINAYNRYHYDTVTDCSRHIRALRANKSVIPNDIYCHQYLISKSYAVRLFFAPNHWANGKTAIELGIAIDATTIK